MHSSRLRIVLLLLLQSMISHCALGAEMCTKSVPVQRIARKKVSVLRRVPASCSNWEKAWSWVTKQDCGTKYRLDMVEVPSPKVVTYRMIKICCDGDTQCQQAQADDLAARKNAAAAEEEKFLTIVLGSCAAVFLIVILVVTISLCRKKKRCLTACEERKHVYITTEEEDESSELQTHKAYRHEEEDQPTQAKVCGESLYAEIHDPGLPRYADIFREDASPDRFQHATAPPITLYESRSRGLPTNDKRPHSQTKQTEDVGETICSLLQENKPPHKQCLESAKSGVQCNQRNQNEKCGYPDQSVPSVTSEDPAVVPVSPSLSLSSATSPQNRKRRGCDERCRMDGSPVLYTCPNKACPSQYESLSSRGCKDCHEYQRLSMTAVGDVEQTSVGDPK
ncbi:hypothetical protein ACOMHN_007052 [Nucella lapillus]